ncbi:acyl-CoA dehydrogenase family protein [uncultured Sphingorhabdus sp.]|uniref:acyl-CoA dehydrogenase family protein n=1 Tax=uncultured Sphingorhabdus sp. TaxID=1686106 RepID=UPI00261B1D2F|nr:acyl-CoA dehydrogenase family protein [uncultured Sphingorhabdus sp.]HMS20469.1 acyl-CoA dehydrogenase family protein [Sphingorhabdus sp.]
MNFDFSEEQLALKDEARKFLAAKCPPDRVRKLMDEDSPGFDPELWAQVAEQGWLGAAIPEEHGGLGLGYLELCCIAEELGRAVAPVPFASTVYFFAEALLRAGSAEQKAKYLPQVVTGELIGTIASAEQAGAVSAANISAEVSGGKLTGVKLPVTDGAVAHHAVVLAKEGGKPTLYIVDLNGPGVAREAVNTIDRSREAARVEFKDAPVERLGEVGDGLALFEAINDRAAVLIAFEQVGGSDMCLEMAKNYALERFAFGRAIGGYQAIKHRLADMYAKNVLARGNAYYGAWALNSDAPELPIAAAGARISACDAYWFAAKENVQVHGGMGFTWEIDAHLHYRRSRQLALVAGSARNWKHRLVSMLERRNAA